MKGLLLFIELLFAFLFISGCSYDFMERDSLSIENKSNTSYDRFDKQNIIYAIAVKYLCLNGQTYSLDLEETRALGLGITRDCYYNIQAEINAINFSISKWIEEGLSVELMNPQTISIPPMKRLKSTSEPTPRSRSIYTYDNQLKEDIFFAPNGISFISFDCYANGDLLQSHYISTETNGVVKSKIGIIPYGNIWSDTIELVSSNTNCIVSYQTSCSSGGVCTYSW